jgi:hypothetical protein
VRLPFRHTGNLIIGESAASAPMGYKSENIDATSNSTATADVAGKRQSHLVTFSKVFNGRKQPIRIWIMSMKRKNLRASE